MFHALAHSDRSHKKDIRISRKGNGSPIAMGLGEPLKDVYGSKKALLVCSSDVMVSNHYTSDIKHFGTDTMGINGTRYDTVARVDGGVVNN